MVGDGRVDLGEGAEVGNVDLAAVAFRRGPRFVGAVQLDVAMLELVGAHELVAHAEPHDPRQVRVEIGVLFRQQNHRRLRRRRRDGARAVDLGRAAHVDADVDRLVRMEHRAQSRRRGERGGLYPRLRVAHR